MKKFIKAPPNGTMNRVFHSFDKRIKIEFGFNTYQVYFKIPGSDKYTPIYKDKTVLYGVFMNPDIAFDYGYSIDKSRFTLQIGDNIITGKMEDFGYVVTAHINVANKYKSGVHNTCIIAYRDKGKVVEGKVISKRPLMGYNSIPLEV